MGYNFTSIIAASGIALAAFSMGTGEAKASLVDLETCSVGGVTVTGFNPPSGDAIDCAGAFAGNDTNSDFLTELKAGNIFAGYGELDLGYLWSQLGKSDDGNPSVTTASANGTITWQATGVKTNTVVTVKASNCFSAFLFSPLTTTNISGEIDLSGSGIKTGGGNSFGDCDGRNIAGLSHISVFVAGGDIPPPPPPPPPGVIPLPAAGWLLLGGLGALAAVRRRRKAA